MELIDGSTSRYAREKLDKHKEYTVTGPSLGPVNRATLARDPKHLGFTLSRYKFVSKMLQGKEFVCEIGCHEATGSLIVAKEVGHLTALDLQADVIEFCKTEYGPLQLNISFFCVDALDGLPPSMSKGNQSYDAIYLLDVLEHVDPKQENMLMSQILKRLTYDGVAILGIPSLESQVYASPVSKAQHINCKSFEELRLFLKCFFGNVFMFGMNDEMLHTGFGPMCQYHLALCTHPNRNLLE